MCGQASLDQEPGPEIFVLDFRQLPGPSGPPGSPRYVVMRNRWRQRPPWPPVPSKRGPPARFGRPRRRRAADGTAGVDLHCSSTAERGAAWPVRGRCSHVGDNRGLYGVMAYAVSQRTREIGIRMAIGAQQVQVMKLILSRSVGLIVVGIIFGLAAAAAMSRYLRGMLFGLASLDPTTFLSVAAIFGFVALSTDIPACPSCGQG